MHTFVPIGLFVLGFILILIEVFTPGLGIFALVGVVCIGAGIFILADDFKTALLYMAIVVVGLLLTMPFIVKALRRLPVVQRMFIKDALKTEEGFVSRKSGMEDRIGARGVALTDLRPAGTVRLEDDARIDVVTRGEFIVRDTPVEVIALEGTWYVVGKIS